MADFDTLTEASYEGVTFPVTDAPVDGGNDFAEHTAYRREGADMEPTGRRAFSGSLTIPCINTRGFVARYGTMWPDKATDLISLFGATPRGTLVHPLLGTLVVAIATELSQSGASEVRNGVTLTVKWKEHNASLSLLVGAAGALTTDTTTTVTTKATTADTAGASVAGYVNVASAVTEQADFLESAVRTYSEVQGSFRLMLAAVDRNLTLAGMLTVDGYAAMVASLNLRAALYLYRSRFVPGDDAIRYYTVPETMGLADVSRVVYGNLAGMTLIASANTILDPMQIAAGRVLTILPAA